MDTYSARKLAALIRQGRVASLGTLRDGAPLVSLVVFSAAEDFSEFYVHVSRLAQHTQDIMNDPRVSLMIAESESGVADAQTLARVSMRGNAVAVVRADTRFETIKQQYLQKFPASEQNFDLGDFSLYGIVPQGARFVAGFGKILNLTPANFAEAAAIRE
ncbi:MAG: pyridoxamine 5'-phosphate oxidase family protein [Chloroflexi bacterium]|nr:pyridoxamine 5'-phosphate oxidase family protein [Chloroflexota bacterium]